MSNQPNQQFDEDGDQFLLGGGVPSVKFHNIGDSVTGKVLSTEVRDQTKMGSNEVLRWDDGKAKKQLVVRLQTTERDPEVDGDTGQRALYVKGAKKAGSRSLHDAVATAARQAGATSIVGGTLTVTYVDNAPASTAGYNDRKLYSAHFVPGDASGDFLAVTQPQVTTPATAPAAAQPAQAPQAPAQAAPVGRPPNLTPEQAAIWDEMMAAQARQVKGLVRDATA